MHAISSFLKESRSSSYSIFSPNFLFISFKISFAKVVLLEVYIFFLSLELTFLYTVFSVGQKFFFQIKTLNKISQSGF